MKILIAGSPTNKIDRMIIKHNLGKLYSILHEKKHIANWDHGQFLMVDSGAHSWNKLAMNKVGMKASKNLPPLEQHIKDYLAFIREHRTKPFTFVELDVYATLPKQRIDDLYKQVMEIKAEPGSKFQFMRVYHENIDNGSLEVLKQWLDEGQNYIGLGFDVLPIYKKIFHLTKDRIKYHCFGMTQMDIMEEYPFYSVDSTSPLAVVIFGCAADEMLKLKSKALLIREHSPRILEPDDFRLEHAVIQVKLAQEFITNLWAQRGVIWKD